MSATAADLRAPAPGAPRLVLRRRHVIALAALVPALLAGLYVSTNVRASLAQRSLQEQWRIKTASAPVDAATLSTREPLAGEPVARLGIAAIGLDLIVTEGGLGDMHRAPAHRPASVMPGLPGVAIVEAGRFGYGNMFLHLGRLVPGDTILVETLAGRQRFVVRSIGLMPAAAIDPGEDTAGPTLLLVSPARAWGSDDRIVVRAEIAGEG